AAPLGSFLITSNGFRANVLGGKIAPIVNWYTKRTTFHGAIFPLARQIFLGKSPTPTTANV
ncbi:MAG: hypothetical protein ACREPR_22870, partial [Brasilonema sp.]